jgi:hypothetical protein
LSPLATKVHVRLAQLGDHFRYDEMISPPQFFRIHDIEPDVDFSRAAAVCAEPLAFRVICREIVLSVSLE